MWIRITTVLGFVWACAAAQDLSLLPQPRTVRAGQGRLLLSKPTIGFARKANAEDELVRRQLKQILSESGVNATDTTQSPAILLDRTSDSSSWQWDDAPGPNSSEAYTLKVTPAQAVIRASTSRGLYYGVQTLRQLLRSEKGGTSLPAVEIEDWPAMRLRGFMLDLSHGPFPKFEELKRQLDFLARWKTNQFYLYSETNIELDGYPLLSQYGRLSKAQVKELIAYARERFIDVVPCVELYGHLHDLARVETYAALGEMTHGGEINPLDSKAQALIRDWVDQFAALFPSPYFHVGLDETYELGKVPGRQLPPQKAGEIYLNFFKQVSDMVSAKGKRVMVWSDILLQHPEVIPKLPPGTIAVPWRYAIEASYDKFVTPLAEAKVQTMVGTGVWNYYEAAPDFDHTIENVNGFVASGRKVGSAGILHTEWTDCIQVLIRMADPGAAYGSIAGWSHELPKRDEIYRKYAQILYPGHAEKVSRMLALISESQATLESVLGMRVFQTLWVNPMEEMRVERARSHAAAIREARLKAEEVQAILLALQKEAPDAFFDTLLYGARLLDYAALRQLYAIEFHDYRREILKQPTRANYQLLFRIETSDHTHSRLFDLMDAAGELTNQLRSLWLRDYLPYRLETSLARWRGEIDRWRVLQERLFDAGRVYRDGDAPPPLYP